MELAGRFQQEIYGRVEVFDKVIWAGGTQGFCGECTPAYGDAHDAGGMRSGNVEGSVADVSGSFGGDVAK